MAAPSESYVDPSIAGNSGSGTIGDPWGDLQYALDQVTRDSTNGDRFNIKAGTDEALTAGLDVSTYGTPAINAPLILQGYTSAAGDGGQGGVDCGGSNGLFASTTLDGVRLIDLHVHNGGSTALVRGDDWWLVYRCEIDDTTSHGILIDDFGFVGKCNIHNVGTNGVSLDSGYVVDNYFANGTNDMTNCIDIFSASNVIAIRNIMSIDGSTNGIGGGNNANTIISHNSILSAGGTGTGISGSDVRHGELSNNLVEGFSGTGGQGIDTTSSGEYTIVEGNAVYNNATNYALDGSVLITASDNETLSESPFAKSGSDTFANRFTYFAPVDTGNVFGGAFSG